MKKRLFHLYLTICTCFFISSLVAEFSRKCSGWRWNGMWKFELNRSTDANKILSTAQDIVYNTLGGKHWTSKHHGLKSALHQATRSKKLVQLFYRAGHVISYSNILQVDTALAESTSTRMNPLTGAVVPPNLVQDRFIHFTCDNIDINDANLDGKNTFHATQVAAWQRGPEPDMVWVPWSFPKQLRSRF